MSAEAPLPDGVTRETLNGEDVVVAVVRRAVPWRRDDPPRVASVIVRDELPEDRDADLGPAYDAFRLDAERVHAALSHALPGGTLDALFALMCAERASAYVVPTPWPDRGRVLRELVTQARELVDIFTGEPTRREHRTAPDTEADELVEAHILCGVPLHPAKPEDVEPCGITCALPDGHDTDVKPSRRVHDDGTGNRWNTAHGLVPAGESGVSATPGGGR